MKKNNKQNRLRFKYMAVFMKEGGITNRLQYVRAPNVWGKFCFATFTPRRHGHDIQMFGGIL